MPTTLTGDTGVSKVQDGVVNPATDIAYSQTWQDVTGSRSIGSNQTNSTGQPITAMVSIRASTLCAMYAYINGVQIAQQSISTSGYDGCMTLIIPNGATYRFDISAGSPTLQKWWELR